MDKRVRDLHDELLADRPQGAEHDASSCPICREWAMTPDGVPASAAGDKPYGDVEYADPGLLDGVHRYPVDTLAHARASHSYITSPAIAKKYTEEQRVRIVERIEAAIKRFESDGADVQPSQEGLMETISKETHEALLRKAVEDAVAAHVKEIASLKDQLTATTSERDEGKTKIAELEEANEKLNGDLDQAQASLKNANDKVAELEGEIAKRDEQAALALKGAERAKQVRTLSLFDDSYIEERAERWAKVSDEEWNERIEEWKAARTTKGASRSDSASAFKGSSEGDHTVSPIRAVLSQ